MAYICPDYRASLFSPHLVFVYTQGNGRLKVYDMEAKCFECDIKITESRHGKSARLVSITIVIMS